MSRHHKQLDTEEGEIDDAVSSPRLPATSSAAMSRLATESNGRPTIGHARSRSRSPSRSRNQYPNRRAHERCGGSYSRDGNRHRSRSPKRGESTRFRRGDEISRTSANDPSVYIRGNPSALSSVDVTASPGAMVGVEEVPLCFDEDEEAGAERELEARRRRRREILEMHATQCAVQSTTVDGVRNLSIIDNGAGSSGTGCATDAQSGVLVLEKKGAIETNPDNGLESLSNNITAANYNPNDDVGADDVRHRVAAQEMAKARLAVAPVDRVADNQTITGSTTNSDDGFDMFADNAKEIVIPSATRAKSSSGATAASTMVDDWDDAEGYYRTNIGELLDGRYLVQAFLGQGVFSSVVKAVDTKSDNEPVAIKIIRQNETMHKAGTKEKRMLGRLEAADPSGKMHVVRLLGSFVHRGHLCLCFELMSLNLREVVRKYGRDSGLSLQAVRVYATHLLLALDLLRRCDIVHGDLKPGNCFVSELRNNVKLGDLGSASDVSENEITPYLVSRFYRAPEVILGMPHDCSIDVWSLGVTLFELYTGKIMFPGQNNNHMLRFMMEARGHFPNKMLRRGQLWHQHFEDNGGNLMDFVSRTHDRIANAEIAQRMVFAKPTHDIKSRILQATPTGSAADEVQQALQFANLLDRCLELNPEKRATPIEALRHPFFAQK